MSEWPQWAKHHVNVQRNKSLSLCLKLSNLSLGDKRVNKQYGVSPGECG